MQPGQSGGFVGGDLFDDTGSFAVWFWAWTVFVLGTLLVWPAFVFLKLRAWLYRLGAAPHEG